MRYTRAAIATLSLALYAGCATTVVDDQPTLDRALAAALEARRLDAAADHVLAFRDGLLREATDRNRLDRVGRAAAAARTIADLRAELAAIHRGRLDDEGRVDLDLGAFLLDGAEEEIRVAGLDEEFLRALVPDAAQAEFLAAAGPPSPEMAARLLHEAPGWFRQEPPLPAAAASADTRLLRAAGHRTRQAAAFASRRGTEALALGLPQGEGALAVGRAAVERSDGIAKAFEEAAKSRDDGAGGFAPPLGREPFAALLRSRHGVAESPEAVEAWGLELLSQVTAELDALAAAHFPGKTWREALEVVRDDHATPAEMPAEAQRAAEEAREFCIARGLVTIPPAARLGHIDLVGEDMARSYPFAAYSFRLSTPEGESGRYMVSPGATWMNAQQREERVRGNCRAWTRVVAPHETWPGHHLQFWVADHLCSRLRREAMTPVFVEGWGLYGEWLLDRHGYFKAPGERLCVLAMRAWRACRVVLDVRLHCGGFTPEEGIEFLVANSALTRDAAAAEVRRYMSNPTQPFSYAWGWREILRLRADEEARLGASFSERAFHDRLLLCGPIPFPFVRRLFGYGE